MRSAEMTPPSGKMRRRRCVARALAARSSALFSKVCTSDEGSAFGPAAGAGSNLALVADVVIAAESAYFLQAFARIGLVPDAGGTWVLPRQMGMAKAMGAALFAEPIGARQASDWGMIWEAVSDEGFAAHWRARAAQLAKGPTQTFAGIRQALRESWSNTLEAQLDLEARLQGRCGQSRDFKEGVMAFLEKRPPQFEGR